jgi:peptidoglycan/xylan/chitin deacetylase (PgdA/CDA1 family)
MAVDVAAARALCAARDTNLEGIPTFVALQDLAGGADPASTPELTGLAAEYVAGAGDLAQGLEALAAEHFGPETVLPGFVRVINYHNTIARCEDRLRAQLAAAAEAFAPVTEAELMALIAGEPWAKDRPPLIPVFYEGYRNNYDVALKLLEETGLVGWFVVPSAFPDAPVAEQRAWAERYDVGLEEDAADFPADGRYALTWDELRAIAGAGHVVACHTAHHRGTADIAGAAEIGVELVGSRARLEQELGREVRALAFLWGSPWGEAPMVDAAVLEAGYRLVISNTKWQRLGAPPA